MILLDPEYWPYLEVSTLTVGLFMLLVTAILLLCCYTQRPRRTLSDEEEREHLLEDMS
jgi:hypothetical protein